MAEWSHLKPESLDGLDGIVLSETGDFVCLVDAQPPRQQQPSPAPSHQPTPVSSSAVSDSSVPVSADCTEAEAVLDALKAYRDEVSGLAEVGRKGVEVLDGLQAHHAAVSAKTMTLHSNTKLLLEEQSRLKGAVEKIQQPMSYYDDLHRLGKRLRLPLLPEGGPSLQHETLTPLSPRNEDEFLAALQRIDECIQYLADNQRQHDAPTYLVKFQQLQMRALGEVKQHVVDCIEALGLSVSHELKATVAMTEAIETQLLYVKFRTQLTHLPPLMGMIRDRADRGSIAELALDCYSAYLDHRLGLVGQVMSAKMTALASDRDLLGLTRASCAYAVRMCHAEHGLFHQLFFDGSEEDDDDSATKSLDGMLEELCGVLSDLLRPRVLAVQELDTLCELVHILSTEILEDSLRSRGTSVGALHRVVTRLVQDVQERLIYRCQCHIQADILAFRPKASDQDYPALLQRHYEKVRSEKVGEEGEESKSGSGGEAGAGSGSAGGGGGGGGAGNGVSMYDDTWYATLPRTLLCLSKIYRCVESSIFESLGQDAVSACTASFLEAAYAIHHAESAIDGDLFIIKHLLILREQIAPFEIGFTTTEKRLDFRSTQEALAALVARTSSVFSLSSDNPLLAFVIRGIPTIAEDKVNSTRDLEIELKQACERFIARATQAVSQPLLQFVDEASRFQSGPAGGTEGALASQPFASAAKMRTMVDSLRRLLQRDLPMLRAKIALYLRSPLTQTILWKPVATNLLNAFTRWRQLLQLELPALREEFLPLLTVLLQLVDRSDACAVDPAEVEVVLEEPAVVTAPSLPRPELAAAEPPTPTAAAVPEPVPAAEPEPVPATTESEPEPVPTTTESEPVPKEPN